MAAQIGAQRLSEAAERLEQALRARGPGIELESLHAQLVAALQPLLAGLAACLSGTAAPLEPGEAAQWQALRTRLLELLDQSDSEAVALFEAQLPLCRTVLGAGFEPIAVALHDFDFETAEHLLAQSG